jgi:HEAT repeat protein
MRVLGCRGRSFCGRLRIAILRVPEIGICVGLSLGILAVGCSSEPTEDGKPLSFWIQRLRDREPQSRQHALGAIAAMGPAARAALPAIRSAIDDPDGSVGCDALMTYQIVSKDTIDWAPVVRALAKGERGTRGCAASVLSKGRGQGVPALIAALADPEPGVRAAAARSLGWIGADAASALPALIELGKDDHPDVVQAAGIAAMLIRQAAPTPR